MSVGPLDTLKIVLARDWRNSLIEGHAGKNGVCRNMQGAKSGGWRKASRPIAVKKNNFSKAPARSVLCKIVEFCSRAEANLRPHGRPHLRP
jgi:hypothetical protein